LINATLHDSVLRLDLARTIAGRGRYWTAAYYIDGLLIDTGCAYTAKELEHVLSNKSLFQIVNTHTHEDHIGANGLLQRQRDGLAVLVHPLAVPILINPRSTQPLELYRRIMWGWPDASVGRPVQDGEKIETEHHCFQVIYTPGHSPDHICLYESTQGWLFTGDLYVGGWDRALRKDNNIWQTMASLEKIMALSTNILFPGSARVRIKPESHIRAKINYLKAKGQRVLELYQKGWDEHAIANKVFGSRMLIEFATMGHFSRINLVRSYLRGA
jgi:glyoxylase-like metal-dependent hydrolase (beta-lactamase superfamily II)